MKTMKANLSRSSLCTYYVSLEEIKIHCNANLMYVISSGNERAVSEIDQKYIPYWCFYTFFKRPDGVMSYETDKKLNVIYDLNRG